jgi:putative oxidoreductase
VSFLHLLKIRETFRPTSLQGECEMHSSKLIRSCDVAARILIASLFLYSGIGKVIDPAITASKLAGAGFPMPMMVAYATIVLELGSAILLMVGYRVMLACAALAFLTFTAALFFHQWWAVEPSMKIGQTIHFLKNAAILGGLWFVARSEIASRTQAS